MNRMRRPGFVVVAALCCGLLLAAEARADGAPAANVVVGRYRLQTPPGQPAQRIVYEGASRGTVPRPASTATASEGRGRRGLPRLPRRRTPSSRSYTPERRPRGDGADRRPARSPRRRKMRAAYSRDAAYRHGAGGGVRPRDRLLDGSSPAAARSASEDAGRGAREATRAVPNASRRRDHVRVSSAPHGRGGRVGAPSSRYQQGNQASRIWSDHARPSHAMWTPRRAPSAPPQTPIGRTGLRPRQTLARGTLLTSARCAAPRAPARRERYQPTSSHVRARLQAG